MSAHMAAAAAVACKAAPLAANDADTSFPIVRAASFAAARIPAAWVLTARIPAEGADSTVVVDSAG
eukprot:4494094-Prymnesium_polylepis.1